jgi:hypothetical protein
MTYQQKKADSVGVGLLKEGDNANFVLSLRLPIRTFLTFANGLLRVPIYIDAKEPEKLQDFPKILKKPKKTDFHAVYILRAGTRRKCDKKTGLFHRDDLAEACTIEPSRHLRRFIQRNLGFRFAIADFRLTIITRISAIEN